MKKTRSKSMIESWEWDRNANTLTWLIKPGIPFHNPDFGEVDAEDVAFQFQRGNGGRLIRSTGPAS